MLSNPLAIAATASVLFALSHYPRVDLMILTLIGGMFFTLIYRRYPNLWAVGIAHGVLGALAVYLVVKEDPGAVILNYVIRP
jgi:membrane protease YdiL (CAAX protease family)